MFKKCIKQVLTTELVFSCQQTAQTMPFKLYKCAQKRWIRLHRFEKLAMVIKGVKFVDGIEINRIPA